MAQVWLVDKYGEQVIQLHEKDGYYALPESATQLLLDVGDEYRVECFDDGDDER